MKSLKVHNLLALCAIVISTLVVDAQTTCEKDDDSRQPTSCSCCGGSNPGPAGPTGPPGASGVTGPSGVPGVQGPQGMTGPVGNRGEPGRDGDRGFKGEKGEAGLAGKAGESGPRGPAGFDGDRGEKGEKGDRGVAGSDGDKGVPGVTGPLGQKGAKGIQGDEGIAGTKGQTGVKGDKGSAGVKGTKGDEGVAGDAGSDGAKGEKGDPGTPYKAPKIVMFMARRLNRLDVNSGTQTITYEAAELNIGEDLDRNTGIFTCRIKGLYFFSFNFWTYSSQAADIRLMHNGYSKARVYQYPLSGNQPISYSLFLALDVDDEVSLVAHTSTDIQAATYGENTFNGHLVQATDDNLQLFSDQDDE